MKKPTLTTYFKIFQWLLSFLIVTSLTSDACAQVTCNSTGNWSTSGVWSPASPAANQTVTVAVGCTLYVDVSTVQISDLTVNGTLVINANATSDLNISGNVTINNGGVIENNGSFNMVTSNKNFTINGNGMYIHNPFINAIAEETIFSNSNESFSATSTLDIKKWAVGSIPLGDLTRVQSSNFGNLILEANVPGGQWDQNGCFSLPTPGRVKGTLTVNSGTILMDNGSGNTTSLALQDVNINNGSNVIFQRGSNRNLTLVTGNFNLNSTSPAAPTVVLDTSMGTLNWTVNGNLNIGYDFNAVNALNYSTGSDIRITVNGNFNYTKGNVVLVNKADAPLKVIVNGNTVLNNTSGTGKLNLIEGGNGVCTFSTVDFNLQAGTNNYLLGTPTSGLQYKGTATFTISNDFNASGTSSLYMYYADSSTSKLRLAIGRDFNLNGNTSVFGSNTIGAFTLQVARNFSLTQGKFSGQNNFAGSGIDSITIGTSFTFNSSIASDFFRANRSAGNTIFSSPTVSILNSGLGYGQGVSVVDSGIGNLTFNTNSFTLNTGRFCGILSGYGNLTFNCTGAITINGGIFKGNENTLFGNSGGLNFIAGSINYNGGLFSCYNNVNISGSVGTVTINGICNINFNASSDEFSFIGLASTSFDLNNISLNLSITGAFNILGANGTFISSRSLGSETISLNSMTISSGNNSFNSVSGSAIPNGHNVTMIISNNVNINGGDTYLSGYSQTFTGTCSGSISITNGSLAVKGGDCTTSTLNVLGGFTMTGGEFYLHKTTTDELPASSTITVNINSNDDNVGDFNQSSGTIYFDNCATTPSALNLILNIKSPNYILSGNGNITMTKAGFGLVYGNLNFARNGLINFNRSGNHLIQQVKQTVNTACTLDIITGDLQIASNNSVSTPPEFLWVNAGGILNAHSSKIFSNALNTNSGITILGRLRTSHPNGLYNATTNATFSTTVTDNLDYYLSSSSIIEYYGTGNQIVTGIGIGKALFSYHKYGVLDINFQGIGVNDFAYPTNVPNDSSVSIRQTLMLTKGEFNLDDDHDPTNGGGRIVTIESGSTLGMQRSTGYIRSEVENNSALVKWTIGTTVGAHVFHFGYSSSEYIPFTYNHVSGTSGSVYLSTYHTIPANTPLPPTVTHIRNNFGLDNSANTVDRYWYINLINNSTYNSNLIFTATPTEIGSITNLYSQRWVQSVTSWTNPVPGTQTPNANGNTTNGINNISNWWTLSGNNTPLPVDLLSFNGTCDGNKIKLEWSTASELNNDHFEIFKSSNGSEFTKIGIVNGHGTSSISHDYSFEDFNLESDIIYYQLVQVDFDLNKKEYDPIAVKSCGKQHLDVAISSDGSAPTLFIQTLEYLPLRIVVFDTNGKRIFETIVNTEGGLNTIYLPINENASGVYYLNIESDQLLVSKKFYLK